MNRCLQILFLSGFLLTGCGHQTLRPRSGEAPTGPVYDADLAGFTYPFPVKFAEVQAQGQNLRMAFMDEKPEARPGQPQPETVVLLHGKNFSGFYFEGLARELLRNGYRVFIPDQIGFGKSSKPVNFQYSFHQLAQLTDRLLKQEGIGQFILVGHSMGGMLAARMALMYPDQVKKLIMINPIGLEDYKLLTPYKSVSELENMELQNTPEKIRRYQIESYYDGKWSSNYESLIQPAIGWLRGPDSALLARTAALTSEMIYTQPVVYELSELKVPTVLILGQRDRTAIGRGWAPKETRDQMGLYPQLGRKVARKNPRVRLIELNGLGHVPFLEDPKAFNQAFGEALQGR